MARQKCPEKPIILVSGTMGEEVAVESLKRGATDYVLKDRLARLPEVLGQEPHGAKVGVGGWLADRCVFGRHDRAECGCDANTKRCRKRSRMDQMLKSVTLKLALLQLRLALELEPGPTPGLHPAGHRQ